MVEHLSRSLFLMPRGASYWQEKQEKRGKNKEDPMYEDGGFQKVSRYGLWKWLFWIFRFHFLAVNFFNNFDHSKIPQVKGFLQKSSKFSEQVFSGQIKKSVIWFLCMINTFLDRPYEICKIAKLIKKIQNGYFFFFCAETNNSTQKSCNRFVKHSTLLIYFLWNIAVTIIFVLYIILKTYTFLQKLW